MDAREWRVATSLRQTPVPVTLLAHRPRPLTNILVRFVHVPHLFQLISSKEKGKEEEIGVEDERAREDGEERRIQSRTEPGYTGPHRTAIW